MTLRVGSGEMWRDEARAEIHRLEAGGRLVIRPASAPLHPAGCYKADSLDLVRIVFDFPGREDEVPVRLQRVAMVALLKALRSAPRGIVVGYGGTGSTASYRTPTLQAELRARYEAGIGGLAAEKCESYHVRGLSIDAPHDDEGEAALIRAGFLGIGPSDPSHFTYGVRG